MERLQIHDDIPKSEIVTGIWERAEVFDFNTEMVFRYLQVSDICGFHAVPNQCRAGVPTKMVALFPSASQGFLRPLR